jgi:hypothetical protein
MTKPWPTKDPDSNQRYYFDWRPWITVEEGGTISDFSVTVDDGDGALLIGDFAMGTGVWSGVVMLWISGGTVGVTYNVRCRVTLADGTVEDRSRALRVCQH